MKFFNHILGIFAVYSGVFVAPNCLAESIEKNFIHTGPITQDSFNHFQSAVNAGNVPGIELHDSNGASDWAPLLIKQYGELIVRHQLPTYVKGNCSSACAAIFLFGKKKIFLAANEGGKTFLHFHPVAYIFNDETDINSTQEIILEILRNNPDSPDLKVLDWMYKVKDRFGGVLVFRDIKKTGGQIFFQEKYGAGLVPLSPYTIDKLGITIE
ncbi:hypothetical protein [Undibacterium pigrum]|uniref:Uncharacterized protein n=1 Tax=Undibacterium pigrum TaxID=401470 RepID=A0A318J4E5_9BURK|nr:hypothetical protein [Undibacterium pigrum]PXX42544.1 hypothetical protein DFR42_105202 [Undibacterium pigrum]